MLGSWTLDVPRRKRRRGIREGEREWERERARRELSATP
jgi:hypothetical protein